MNFDKYRDVNSNPQHLGLLEDYNARGVFRNHGCGDDYEIYLKIEDDVIQEAKFKTTGCGFGLAALELTLRAVKGKTLDEARQLDPEVVSQGIDGFPEGRLHYIQEAHEALVNALDNRVTPGDDEAELADEDERKEDANLPG